MRAVELVADLATGNGITVSTRTREPIARNSALSRRSALDRTGEIGRARLAGAY